MLLSSFVSVGLCQTIDSGQVPSLNPEQPNYGGVDTSGIFFLIIIIIAVVVIIVVVAVVLASSNKDKQPQYFSQPQQPMVICPRCHNWIDARCNSCPICGLGIIPNTMKWQ